MKENVLFYRKRWTRKRKAMTRSWDLDQADIDPFHVLDKVTKQPLLLFAPFNRTNRSGKPSTKRLVLAIHKFQSKVKTVRIILPPLERPQHCNHILDGIEIHSNIPDAVSHHTVNDTAIEASNVLGTGEVEHRLDVLVRVRDIGLGGVVTKSVDVVNHEPDGGIGHVCVARREEVKGKTRTTRKGDLELVPTGRFKGATLKGAVALLEDANRRT